MKKKKRLSFRDLILNPCSMLQHLFWRSPCEVWQGPFFFVPAWLRPSERAMPKSCLRLSLALKSLKALTSTPSQNLLDELEQRLWANQELSFPTRVPLTEPSWINGVWQLLSRHNNIIIIIRSENKPLMMCWLVSHWNGQPGSVVSNK